MKKLVVNADDFGNSRGINKGIIKAFKKGIVTSTSLMVDGQAAKEAVELARENPGLGVGLHFVLTDKNARVLRMAKKAIGIVFAKKVGKELRVQFEKFQKLTGKIPDHLDAHYHVHKLPRIFPRFLKLSREYKISLRDTDKIGFIGSFFGMSEITGADMPERVSVKSLLKILRELPDGISELMCHPGYVTPDLKSSYNKHREVELKTLTDPRVKEFIHQKRIYLINFSRVESDC